MKHPFRHWCILIWCVLICLAAVCSAQNNTGQSGATAQRNVAAQSNATEGAAAAPVSPPATSQAVPENPPQRKSGSKAAPAAGKSAKGSTAPYVIGSLDVLSIKVWNNANLTQLVDVRPDGMFSMPLIGEVKADGLTVDELRSLLTTKLGDFLTEPEVDIQVVKINSKKYYVLGDGAARPGVFPLTDPITVLEAISNAGGFRDFANPKKIYILRGTQRFYFNYKEVIQGKHLEQDIQIQNGDKIVIP